MDRTVLNTKLIRAGRSKIDLWSATGSFLSKSYTMALYDFLLCVAILHHHSHNGIYFAVKFNRSTFP
jgi:hypothetical protein